MLAIYIILGFLGASALVTFGWCLRAGVERNNRGHVDLTRAAARGELKPPPPPAPVKLPPSFKP